MTCETNSGIATIPSKETSKSPPSTRTRKRKEMVEYQPKPRVYTRKALEGEPSNKLKKLGSFKKIPTIQEDPLDEGEELEAEQPNFPPTTSDMAIATTISPPPAS